MLPHDASPGYHAASTHLLPFLPQYGTLKQGGEGNQTHPKIHQFGPWGKESLRKGGEVLIMFPPNR